MFKLKLILGQYIIKIYSHYTIINCQFFSIYIYKLSYLERFEFCSVFQSCDQFSIDHRGTIFNECLFTQLIIESEYRTELLRLQTLLCTVNNDASLFQYSLLLLKA